MILGRFISALIIGGCLLACTANTTDYSSHEEVSEGPGLLSGKDGEFVIFER